MRDKGKKPKIKKIVIKKQKWANSDETNMFQIGFT